MSRKSTISVLDENSLVAFDHVAAGHEGVKSNNDGSLVIKPCTQQEINFYESSADHPEFRVFMPTYMGSLILGSPPSVSPIDQDTISLPPSSLNTALATNSNITSPLTAQNLPSTTSSTAPNTLSPTFSHASDLTRNTSLSPSSPFISAHITPWIPNPNPSARHGRALDTDLSIVLENVADGFKHPNILDVKLGSRLWADDAPPNKRVKLDEDSKNSTSGSLGFRIAGMKVWRGNKIGQNGVSECSSDAQGDCEDKDGYCCYNKFYGRKLTAQNVKSGFEEFLGGLRKVELRRLLAARLAQEMRCIKLVLGKEESRMYSASVLIVYEGDEDAFETALRDEKRREQERENNPDCEETENEDSEDFTFRLGPGGEVELNGNGSMNYIDDDEEEEEEIFPKVHDVRLIDFAHAEWTPGQGSDENVLQGVRSMVGILEDLAGS